MKIRRNVFLFHIILNLYYTKKIFIYQKNNHFSKNENIFKSSIYENKLEKTKEIDIQFYKEKYKLVKYLNFSNTSLETFDLNILEKIEDKIQDLIELLPEERMFFHGLIRKIKPKKIIEIGVSRGGSSALILNAIKDIKDAKLFSIDYSINCYKDITKKTGYLVKEKFPELIDKWTLFTGGITSEFIENIGGGIDLAFIDTMHVTPGEMLDWLLVLPFLKNESIVVFHDTFFLYRAKTVTKNKLHTSNNQ